MILRPDGRLFRFGSTNSQFSTVNSIISGLNFTNILQVAFFVRKNVRIFEAFLYLQFGFVIFWQKNIGTKVVRKID